MVRKINPNSKLFAIESYTKNVEILKNKDIDVFSLNIETDTIPLQEEVDIESEN